MRFLFPLCLFLISFAIATSCESQTSHTPTGKIKSGNVDVATFARYQKELKDIQLVDVRTPGETDEGIIPGAIIMDIANPAFKKDITTLDKEKPVLVYCRSGARSGQAMRQMNAMGFKQVYNLEGGISAWESQGQTIIRK